jgi:hypothetical protein
MSTKPKNIEGRVNVALGHPRLKELSTMAKKASASKGALAKAFINNGIDRVKSGEIEILAGVTIAKP